MKNTIISAIILVALMASPVMAAASVCDAESHEDYILKDGPANGHAVHEGLQIGYALEIPNPMWPYFGDVSPFLGIQEFKLKQSHQEQLKVAMVDHYCGLLMNYNPHGDNPGIIEPQEIGIHSSDITGVSENPATSVYEMQHGHRFD